MSPKSQSQPQTFSPEELYNVVCGAASQNPAQVQASATRLKEILQIPGAYDVLHEIASTKSLPLPVRQQSIIQFKNVALSHWKSRKYLSDEQRQRIRERSLGLLDEPDDVISECNEVNVAKIARQDYPQNWPTLIPQIAHLINSNVETRYANPNASSGLPLRRSLEVVNAIIKELSGAKLPSGIKAMTQLSEELRSGLQNHYSRVSSSLATLTPASITQPRIAEDLLLSHLIFKCIVKIADWTWARIVSNKDETMFPWIQQLFQASAMQLQTLSELRINLVLASQSSPIGQIGQQSLELLTRHVRLFGKLFRRMQQLSPPKFVQLPGCSDLVLYYWSKVVQASTTPAEYIADNATAVFPIRFLVQAMVLFKESLPQWAPIKKDGTHNVTALNQEFVENAVKLLVTRFIPLDPADLEEWMADPEGWVNLEEQDNEQWVFEIRPCGERVLLTLANFYPQYVIPLLKTTFDQIVLQHPADLPSVIQKEALYCAVGRCAHKLKDLIPFEQWLDATLIREAQETNSSFPILKRRIAWLIGRWVSEDCYPATNPKIWQVLQHLLKDRGPGTDEVVRLTAAMSLRQCIDSLQFDADVFAPFLHNIVNELVRLTAEAETLESKRRIANSLNTVIECAETRIVPLIPNITQPLPQLWTTAGEDWLFKASLLGTVTKLIESSKEQSVSLSALVVPLVRDSFTAGAQVQLDEDAFILWQSALRNTITLEGVNGGPGLADLFPLVISLLGVNLDLLGRITDIVESYFLLDAPRVLQHHAVDLFRAYVAAISECVGVNIVGLATSLTTLFQVAPPGLWGEALHVSGLFRLMVKTLLDDKATTQILLVYIYVFARIALADRQLFLQLVSATAASQNVPEKTLWEGILEQWIMRFDNISESRFRKLVAMGLTNLVATGRPEVLDRLAIEICNLWIDVFSEIREIVERSQESEDPTLALYWDQPTDSFYRGTEGTLEYNRRQALWEHDVVKTTQFTAYVAVRMQETEVACGGAANLQSAYLGKADPNVLSQIRNELAKPQQ